MTGSAASAPLRRRPTPLPDAVSCVQPGLGIAMRIELGFGRLRRLWLRVVRPGHVARMRALGAGRFDGVPHEVIDARDLKFHHNVCTALPDELVPRRGRGPLGLARLGLGEIAVFGGIALLLSGAAVVWLPWVAPLPLALAGWTVWFFRDPERETPTGPGLVVAPADGTVDDLGEVEHSDVVGGPTWRIGIFLSLFSVHVNRMPCTSRVLALDYRSGRYRATFRVGELERNEQMWTLLETEEPPHRVLAIRQIAGPAARRICNELRPGEVVPRGERFGLIKFGSRTELWLPREPRVEILVRQGDRVVGGETVLARFHDLGPVR